MEFRRIVALALIVGCVSQVPLAKQLPGASALTISGTVFKSDKKTPAPDVRLRLRNLDSGTIAGSTVSDRQGAFSFAAPGPGRYLVEAVGKSGGVMAVGDPVSLAGSAVSTKVILPWDKPIASTLVAIASGLGVVGWIVSQNGTTSPER